MAVLKYYNTSTSAWEYIAASTTANFTSWKKTATGGETSVSGTDDNAVTLLYTVGLEQVFINGVLQVRGSDYTATTGTSVTGLTALVAGDIVTVVCYAPFNIANTIAPTLVDAKGDLIAGTAADTVGRLAVSVSNTAFLRADSGETTGLKWDNDAWTSYTPSFTNLTVGNSTLNFKYKQIGKTVVVRAALTLGSTGSMGTNPFFTLPVTSSSYISGTQFGNMYIEDAAVQGYFGIINYRDTTNANLQVYVANATYLINSGLASNVPFTWGTGDFFSGQFYYEAA
jgi:hypothetical protein